MEIEQLVRLKKAAELEKKIMDKKQEARALENEATIFLASLPLAVQEIFAHEMYVTSMIEVVGGREELVVLASVCAKAAGLEDECLEKLRTWLPGGVVPAEASLILTLSKRVKARQAAQAATVAAA